MRPLATGGWLARKRRDRGRRALERQLDYQRKKAASFEGTEDELMRFHFLRSQLIRLRLEEIKPIRESDRVLEVGSGVGGLVFGFGHSLCFGVDPLAAHYKHLYPKSQSTAKTIAAIGEELPFADASFDLVLSDNVIDHGERPFSIIDEMMRVLRPGGLLFFTVNIHHPIYNAASIAHGAWNAVGLRLELSAFADHTVHLTEKRISSFFERLPLRIITKTSTVAKRRNSKPPSTEGEATPFFKKVFYKNELFEVIAEKLP